MEGAVMTTPDGVTKKKPAEESARAAGCGRAGAVGAGAGLSLTEPDGLLKQLTKTVLETALNRR